MSNGLTANELAEKIAQVVIDLESLKSTGESGRKLEILSEYKSYLEDELKFIKNEQRKKTS